MSLCCLLVTHTSWAPHVPASRCWSIYIVLNPEPLLTRYLVLSSFQTEMWRPLYLRRNVKGRNWDRNRLSSPPAASATSDGIAVGTESCGDGDSASTEEVANDTNKQSPVFKLNNNINVATNKASTAIKERGFFDKAIDPFLNKRPPATDSSSGVSSSGIGDMHVVDCTEVKLNLNSYKMVLLTNKHVILYKPSSMRRAKQVRRVVTDCLFGQHIHISSSINRLLICFVSSSQVHESVTKRMKSKFKKFVDSWLAHNVSENQQQQCTEWLMGRTVETSQLVNNLTTVRLHENDIKKTPYAPYNRYKIIKIDRWWRRMQS